MSENCQACVKKMVASLPGCITKEEASEALVSEPAGASCLCCQDRLLYRWTLGVFIGSL